MGTPERIEAAFNHVEWLRSALHDKEISAAPRIRVAVACLGIAQEHHHSIVLLIDNNLNASAYALLRVSLESYVRGMWLALCACDEQVAKFWAGDNPPGIDALLEQLEGTPGFSEGVLSQIKREHWGTLCGFTHTGGLQVQRWNTETSIEPSYEPKEVAQVLFFAELIGSLAVVGVAQVAHDDELAQRVLVQIKALPSVARQHGIDWRHNGTSHCILIRADGQTLPVPAHRRIGPSSRFTSKNLLHLSMEPDP